MILTILYIVSILDPLSFAMVITTLPQYVYSLGGTQFYLGVLGSISALIALIWNPIVGSLSDSLGRKRVLLQCLLICFVGNFMVTCSTSLVVLFVARLLTAFGTQIMTLMKSLTDDNIKSKDDKMSIISKMQALGGVCFIFGSLASGHLSEYENGYNYIFYIISAVYAINFGLICLIKEDKVHHTTQSKETKKAFNIFKEIKLAAKNVTNVDWPKYWDLFVIKLIIDFSLNVFQFNFGYIVTQRFGVGGKSFGYIFALISVISIITSLTMMKLKGYLYKNDESGLKRLLHANILLALTFGGLSVSTMLTFYIICLVPLSIARVLSDTTFTEVLLSRASPEEKGSILGTFDSTLPLGGLVAPVLSGIISETWGEDMPLLLCTFPLVFGIVLAYSQKTKLE